jgi:hypothetical protein
MLDFLLFIVPTSIIAAGIVGVMAYIRRGE